MGDVRHILVSSDLAELNGMLCLVTVGNDITERKQAEAKLQESEERLRLAQSAANIGTFDWDYSGTHDRLVAGDGTNVGSFCRRVRRNLRALATTDSSGR